MTEPELTTENVGALIGRDAKTESQPKGPEQVELTEDQAELARRYGLAPADARQVRGDTWSEQCQDAERLSKLREQQALEAQRNPNAAELAGLAAKREGHRTLIERLHPPVTNDRGGDQS